MGSREEQGEARIGGRNRGKEESMGGWKRKSQGEEGGVIMGKREEGGVKGRKEKVCFATT